LHETVEQQRATSNDLQNILNSTDVATLFLDGDLRIRFFTPAARSLFNVIASDVGRPLADLTRRFEDDDLLQDARAVLASHAAVRREVKAGDGSWFMRGMLPYRSDDSSVEGVVITFAGISEIKAAEGEIEAARAYLDSIIATIRQPLVVLDDELRVVSASSSFNRIFSIKPEECPHRVIPSSFSDRSRAVVPIDPEHPFRGIPISLWSAGRSVTAPVG
jgi:two-component system CheB/CheR fusion protein